MDEVNAYGDALKSAVAQGSELDLDTLDNVAGGILPVIIGVIAAAASLISYNVSRNAPW